MIFILSILSNIELLLLYYVSNSIPQYESILAQILFGIKKKKKKNKNLTGVWTLLLLLLKFYS